MDIDQGAAVLGLFGEFVWGELSTKAFFVVFWKDSMTEMGQRETGIANAYGMIVMMESAGNQQVYQAWIEQGIAIHL